MLELHLPETAHLFPIFTNGKSRTAPDAFSNAIAFITTDGRVAIMGHRLQGNEGGKSRGV